MDGMMGPECIRSFNGYRSTIELLKLVPNTEVMILIFALIFRLRSSALGSVHNFWPKKIFLRSKHRKTNLDVFEKLSLRETNESFWTQRTTSTYKSSDYNLDISYFSDSINVVGTLDWYQCNSCNFFYLQKLI